MQSAGIEVWTAQPQALGCETCAGLAALLDPEERERVAQLRFDADRRAFVVAHAVRRIAVALALGRDPADLRFGTGPHGQPVLLDTAAESLAFSLTRSRTLVACAVSRIGAVGIDAEPVREVADADVLGTFLEGAQEGGDALSFHEQWTAVEAFWKARGLGLSASHPRIRLQPMEDAPACYEVAYADTGQSSGTVVLRLPAPDGHVLSLACQEVASVRLVSFDRLAAAPRPLASGGGSSGPCTDRRCEYAAATPMES